MIDMDYLYLTLLIRQRGLANPVEDQVVPVEETAHSRTSWHFAFRCGKTARLLILS